MRQYVAWKKRDKSHQNLISMIFFFFFFYSLGMTEHVFVEQKIYLRIKLQGFGICINSFTVQVLQYITHSLWEVVSFCSQMNYILIKFHISFQWILYYISSIKMFSMSLQSLITKFESLRQNLKYIHPTILSALNNQ